MVTTYPCVSFFPALPLERTLALGDWIIGTPTAELSWRSPRFRQLAETHVSSFGELGFRGGAMVWHRERGFDGTPPSRDEIAAIHAAVSFAAFDANDHLGKFDKAYCLSTAENTDLHVQPIDEEDGRITHVEGGVLKSVHIGGWKIGGRTPSMPDSAMAIKQPVRASTKLAAATFNALMTAHSSTAHIALALEWHRVAMANALAVTHQQRIIALKTGFEALLGTSDSRECARRLRNLFETATAAHRRLLPWPGVLWSPGEQARLYRTYSSRGKTKQDVRSEIEDWFMTLATARNSIIHDGVLSVTEYGPPPERPLSRYAGPLFWVGERVLREAVRATLGPEILLCGKLIEQARWDRIFAALVAARTSEPTPTVEGRGPEEKSALRDLPTLLQELRCSAANHVLLNKAAPPGSHSLGAAKEAAAAVEDLWTATAGPRSIAVTAAERDLLEGAGAEYEMPDYFTPCD